MNPDEPFPPPALRRAAETAARGAAKADEHRVLSAEVAESLVAAGFSRHFVPARWGGADGAATGLVRAAATVGEGCASAAWCGAVAAGSSRMGVYLPEEGQAELWADGPDTRVVGALVPAGRAERTDGGWLVSGSWDFTSGVDHSDWAFVCAPDADARPWFFAVPRSGYRIRDTWHNVGMRGTGSNTLVLDGVSVPAHRAFDRAEMLAGRAVGSRSPCHTVPLRGVSGLIFAAPALGAARGAAREWTTRFRGGGETARLAAARAAGAINVADLLLETAAARCDRGGLTPEESLRQPYDCALAVDHLVDAVEGLFRGAGSRGQLAASPLQRFWRDVHCLASHVALRREPAAVAYGGHLLDAE
ncbi:hydrolase [Actinocorallia sp. API 0066]|uniref:hydrolase n=1 Tax=Actinocorallia sp. API 0066 TaxID=2896846 RepID=UPI001E4236BD|nr:hydrolase [Actinocorallia sp. API 0066]MCD0452125.1 hydrolase [Actinocorallia sp. API 0066]